VNTELIEIDGRQVRTLRELLRPGLRAVFIGINPAPTSVDVGHYYQGRLGQRFWTRIQSVGIAAGLPKGREDDEAYKQGLGFADLVRRPTATSDELKASELEAATPDLARRLAVAEGALAVFVFKRAHDFAAEPLAARGWTVARMPGPYEPRASVADHLRRLAAQIGRQQPRREGQDA